MYDEEQVSQMTPSATVDLSDTYTHNLDVQVSGVEDLSDIYLQSIGIVS